MSLNSYRKGISDDDAKKLIDASYPDLHRNVEEYEEVWGDLVEAGKSNSFTKALAIMVDRGPELVLKIHEINPWKPTPNEATLMQAFMPNFFNAALTTYDGSIYNRDGSVADTLVDHTEKMCQEIYERSKKEFEAERRGA